MLTKSGKLEHGGMGMEERNKKERKGYIQTGRHCDGGEI